MVELDWRFAAVVSMTSLAWLSKSVWQPFLKGYFEERGKQRVTREDFERLLAEQQKPTKITEAVKATIQRSEFHYQWRHRERQTAYVNYLYAVRALADILSELRAHASLNLSISAEALSAVNSARSELIRAQGPLLILGGLEAFEVDKHVLDLVSDLHPALCDPVNESELSRIHRSLMSASVDVIAAARKELGLWPDVS